MGEEIPGVALLHSANKYFKSQFLPINRNENINEIKTDIDNHADVDRDSSLVTSDILGDGSQNVIISFGALGTPHRGSLTAQNAHQVNPFSGCAAGPAATPTASQLKVLLL